MESDLKYKLEEIVNLLNQIKTSILPEIKRKVEELDIRSVKEDLRSIKERLGAIESKIQK